MRKIALFLFSAATLLLIAVYLLSCLTPYISQATWWPFTFLALAFPLLAIALVFTIFVWLFVNRKIALVLFIMLLTGYKNLAAVFAVNIATGFQVQKDSLSLRVLDWNVRSFTSNSRDDEKPDGERRRMINFLEAINADVLLLQEFVDYNDPTKYSNVQTLRDSLGYKYYYISNDQTNTSKNTRYGSAIFSRYPLLQPQRIAYTGEAEPESLLMADMLYQHKRIRFATTHLVSLSLGAPPNDNEYFGRKDSYHILHASQLQRLRRYDSIHALQADFIRTILDTSSYPIIASGDFNAVPSSYTYQTIKGKLQDAFLQKGLGFGNSYVGLSPTLRIDYLLLNRAFKVRQFNCPKLVLSDHYPLVADVEWK